MRVNRSPPAGAASLRRRAEDQLKRQGPEAGDPRTAAENARLVHELQVHQIEMEMQNEELRQAQAELEVSRARYFDLYDLAPIGYVTLSEKGLILEANLTAARLLGVARGALVKRPITLFILREDHDIYHRHSQQSFETGAPQVCEFRMLRAGAAPFWVRVEATMATDADGASLCRTAMSDVTERKRVDEQLQRAMADLERSNKDLERFAYVASHDLQEPLRMVSSYTQLLAQRFKGELDENAKKYINFALDGAIRGQRFVGDLLAYSRIGKLDLAPRPTDSHAALSEALGNLAAVIAESGAIITNDGLPTVRADGGQLAQVFLNLVSNAVKFHREGDLPRVHVSARDGGNDWVFSVRDHGIGIDKQYADRIFVMFQRLHTQQEYSGTGIGLAICQRIVEYHGGRIWFESEPGKGSTFFFSLPK